MYPTLKDDGNQSLGDDIDVMSLRTSKYIPSLSHHTSAFPSLVRAAISAERRKLSAHVSKLHFILRKAKFRIGGQIFWMRRMKECHVHQVQRCHARNGTMRLRYMDEMRKIQSPLWTWFERTLFYAHGPDQVSPRLYKALDKVALAAEAISFLVHATCSYLRIFHSDHIKRCWKETFPWLLVDMTHQELHGDQWDDNLDTMHKVLAPQAASST
ncbi:hypothetical protein PsorP6_014554 [Peronosclerospora sorghi]|uniref:Uncharacterized protein n=1 Tax=Peronosclerospora sorghi TaxID=230839 RepID=A0ACC0VTX7_9STRA|nr:hypothetical protein PsorP6_014554 [Peronosclerospora sorghi]